MVSTFLMFAALSSALWANPLLESVPLAALGGAPLDTAALDGKVLLFVNVASRCGYTHQYAGLQQLYEEKAGDGLVIVGVPCNQFGSQEPGAAEEIQTFCRLRYGVTFPLLEKQAVSGADRSPLYATLVGSGADVAWNFEKFLVGRGGELIARFPSQAGADDPALRAAVEAALAAR